MSNLRHAYPAGTLETVELENGFQMITDSYGEGVIYKDTRGLEAAVCEAVLRKPGRLAADEVAFLRVRANWSQEELATLLHVTPQTVSLWERNKSTLTEQSDVLLRRRYIEQAPRAVRPKVDKKRYFSDIDVLVTIVQSVRYVARYEQDTWTVAVVRHGVHELDIEMPSFEGLFLETELSQIAAHIETSDVMVVTRAGRNLEKRLARVKQTEWAVVASVERKNTLTGNTISPDSKLINFRVAATPQSKVQEFRAPTLKIPFGQGNPKLATIH